MRLSALVAAAAALAAAAPPLQPEQVHLALTGAAGEMAVEFFTNATGARVLFGLSPTALGASAAAEARAVTLNGWAAVSNVALMAGLAPATRYFYAVGDAANGFSAVASFVNAPARAGGAVWAIFADLGLANNEALGALITNINSFDYVIHAGDFAYDLDGDGSRVGNAFFAAIEPVASRVAYLPTVGNHGEAARGVRGAASFALPLRAGARESPWLTPPPLPRPPQRASARRAARKFCSTARASPPSRALRARAAGRARPCGTASTRASCTSSSSTPRRGS